MSVLLLSLQLGGSNGWCVWSDIQLRRRRFGRYGHWFIWQVWHEDRELQEQELGGLIGHGAA
jgi:hypothetical protein